MPFDHELRRCVSKRPQSDKGHWQDQGHACQAYGLDGKLVSEHDRIRWHCRRGLLELDLLLNRFLDNGYQELKGPQRDALARLLDLPDHDILDLVMGRAETSDRDCAEIITLLR